MTLFAKHIPKDRRKLVALEGQTHLSGPFDDKILRLADFGDAGQVALDVGCEYRNTRARKALGHHLQRDRLTGSGRAGDEAVAIGKRERQPGRLLTLPDKNLFIGIGHLGIGGRHLIASSRVGGVGRPQRHHTASCKPIETGQRPAKAIRIPASTTEDRPAPCLMASKAGTNVPCRDNFLEKFAATLALLQHSRRDRRSDALIACNSDRRRSRSILISKEPACNRLRAGHYGRTDRTAGRKGWHR